MRDPFALVVLVLGVSVMAIGFWQTVTASSPAWWQIAMVFGGLLVGCIGGYAIGRSLAEPGAWTE